MAKSVDDLLGVGDESVEDDDLLEQDDDLDGDESSEDDEPGDEPLRDAGKEALRKERRTNRQLQKRIKELEKVKQAPAKEADEDALRTKIRSELVQEYGLATAREVAVNVLKDLGYRGNADRGARSLDLSDVLDDDGKVDKDALREAVEDWREDEPALFRRVRRTDVDDEEDEEEPAPVRRRVSNTDMGRKPKKRAANNPLENALSGLVGSDQLHL